MRKIHPHTAKTKRRSVLFFELGMIVALSVTLWAFNVSNRTSDIVVAKYDGETPGYIIPEDIGKITIIRDQPEIQQKTEKFRIDDTPAPLPDPEPSPEPTPEPIPDPGVGVGQIYDPVPLPTPEPDNSPVVFAQKMPSFPGGQDALMKFIAENIEYPPMAREVGRQGRLTVVFVVEKDGSISNIEVPKGLGFGLDEEAIRVVKMMPKWSPGENNYIPVRVRIAIPIKYVLK